MQAVLEYTERALQPATRIGPYRLIKRLRQGGMSTVYLGYHMSTRAYVAIKVVDSSAVDLKMLYREREIMQALEHEHMAVLRKWQGCGKLDIILRTARNRFHGHFQPVQMASLPS